MLIQSGYRYIRIRSRIVIGRKADIGSGIGHSVDVGRATRIGRKAVADGFPAANLEVQRSTQIGKKLGIENAPAESAVVARAIRMSRIPLSAYRVVPITVLKHLIMGRKTAGENAGTQVGTSKWGIRTGRKTAGENADTVITDVKRMMRTGRTAGLDSGTGHTTEAYRGIGMMREVEPGTATTEVFGTSRGMEMGNRVSVWAWCDPELLEDGTLLIKQAYHAEVIDGVLEVS